MRRCLLALACLTMGASGAAAQADAAGAEAAVQAYSDAVISGDWSTAADLLDPRDQERFRELARLITESDPFTASMLGITPDAPIADVLGAFVGIAMEQVPGMDETLAESQFQNLGTILEGDSLAHVVVRTDLVMFERPLSTVEVTTARWDGVRWFVSMDDEIEGMIIGMEAAMENPELFAPEVEIVTPVMPVARDPKKQ